MPKDGEKRLGALDLEAYLADPARKQAFVTPMFDTIAPRYDAFTRLFSFGMDAGWKRDAIAALTRELRTRGIERPRVLDLACGTGDLAVAAVRALPGATALGVDASPRMIDLARQRLTARGTDADVGSHVQVVVGDMDRLDVESATMDAVTAGYGVRNVPDATRAVREMARVLRPGGSLMTLDFYRPAFTPWRALVLGYLSAAGNLVGWAWHRDPVVYGYIARSIDHFMSWQQFSALLEREGLRVTGVKRYLGGAIARHHAVKTG